METFPGMLASSLSSQIQRYWDGTILGIQGPYLHVFKLTLGDNRRL